MTIDEAIKYWRRQGYDVQITMLDSSGPGNTMSPEDFIHATMVWHDEVHLRKT